MPNDQLAEADAWLKETGLAAEAQAAAKAWLKTPTGTVEDALDSASEPFRAAWEEQANLTTLANAIADQIAFRAEEGADVGMTGDEWSDFAEGKSWYEMREKARKMGVDVVWDPEWAQTPEGFYQVRGGIPYAVAKSLAAAPFADIIWMETKTANLAEAAEFAKAMHKVYPQQMLAYNLSPSFNWDTTGMSEEEMRNFPEEIGKLGFVFNFMTYGGHQIDGLATEEFSTALREDGMLSLARLQRKLRLIESDYRTPQTLVGGPRADAALGAVTGYTATTKAMGAGSTQSQHLVQTEVPPAVLTGWLAEWAKHNGVKGKLSARLRPHTAGGSELLELSVLDSKRKVVANLVFATLRDRNQAPILSVRDQNTMDESLRRKRLMTLLHLFLIHRYKATAIHYLTPTKDNHAQADSLKRLKIFSAVNDEVGEIIVAEINGDTIKSLVEPDGKALSALISKPKRAAKKKAAPKKRAKK